MEERQLRNGMTFKAENGKPELKNQCERKRKTCEKPPLKI